jgi:hypothetical protein
MFSLTISGAVFSALTEIPIAAPAATARERAVSVNSMVKYMKDMKYSPLVGSAGYPMR